ncbi:MAG: hypothetical protein QMC89_05860 [Candidatus Hodarchaeaceae archaeon]|nr:hypothetical protein [Candidatus Hodarchaeaceae archaeon]
MTHPLTWAGIVLIVIGVALVLLPILGKYIDFARVPWWLIYVYRSDGFYFVTSPLLILLFLLSAILFTR